jgi:UDP-N-acetylmuramoyl-L-alanyl-D-glutamate--2,6-diaminopimelate ligase
VTRRLAPLLAEVAVVASRGDLEATDVTSVTQDSAVAGPGSLYCCVPGAHVDGHDFADAAVANGARSLLVERFVGADVPQVAVGSVRAAIGPVASALYDHPSRGLSVVGVTGTNGKTTTTHLLGSILRAAGRRTEVLGTLSGRYTTPEAARLQEQLARWRDDAVEAVAMEVSSIALDQHRTDGVAFAAAVWTNLSQDHLDYHGDIERYFDAKARLFRSGQATRAVVNRDDRWGRRLLAELGPTAIAYSLDDARDVVVGLRGVDFTWRGQAVHVPLGGTHNVLNALAAAAAAEALGEPASAIAAGLARAPGICGRWDAVDAGQPFSVLVDFAHTPDALHEVLTAATAAAPPPGRVIVVFGCGGDRDRAKRPRMAAVATALADVVVLTSDNPRGEDPLAIIGEAAAGATDPSRLQIEPDRARAIAAAVGQAREGDVVVIAGKGHETEQILGGTVLPFDDHVEARRALAGLGYTLGPRS